MKISACMIARNEERCIGRCIRSYMDIVDEIIVVDTGSTDRTAAIAQKLGAAVFPFSWRDDFSAAKNYALSHATGDWILFLDADEFFRPGDAKRLLQLLHEPGMMDKAQVLITPMVNIDDKGLPNPALPMLESARIFRGNMGIRYQGAIHEDLRTWEGNLCTSLSIFAHNIPLLHDGYTERCIQRKLMRNQRILEKEFAQHPERTDLCDYMAQGYKKQQDWAASLKYAEICVRSKKSHPFHRLRALGLILDIKRHQELPAAYLWELIQCVERAYPNSAHLQQMKGHLFFSQHQLMQAQASFDRFFALMEIHRERKMVQTLLTASGVARSMLGAYYAYMSLGETFKAGQALIRSLQFQKTPDALELLLLLLREESPEVVWDTLQPLINLNALEELAEVLTLLEKTRVDPVYDAFYAPYARLLAQGSKPAPPSSLAKSLPRAAVQPGPSNAHAPNPHLPTLLLAKGKGKAALKGFYSLYAQSHAEPFLGKMFVAALVCGTKGALALLRKCGSPSYIALCDLWQNQLATPLPTDAYLNVFKELLVHKSANRFIRQWISLGLQHCPDLQAQLARILLHGQLYHQALALTEDLYKQHKKLGKGSVGAIAVDCSLCAYMNGELEKAAWYLTAAHRHGYSVEYIREFSQLLHQKLQEAEKKQRSAWAG